MPGLTSALTGPAVRRLLWPVSVALATAGATAIGLLVAVLVYGQLPRGGAVVPVVVGHGRRGRHRRARRTRAARADQVGGAGAAPRAVRDQPAHRRIGRAAPADRRAAAPRSRGDANRPGQPAHRDLVGHAAAAGCTRSVTLGVTDEAPRVLRPRPHGHLAHRRRRRGLGAALGAAARRPRRSLRPAPGAVAGRRDHRFRRAARHGGRRPPARRAALRLRRRRQPRGGLPAARCDPAQPPTDLRARREPRRPAGHQRPAAALAHPHRHRRRRRAAPHRAQPA